MKILVIGATSAIAEATSRLFAGNGHGLFLVARNRGKLAAVSEDLIARGASFVCSAVLDVLDYAQHESIVDEADRSLGGIDLVLIAHGSLPDQDACQSSVEATRREFEVNALSTISLLTYLSNYFEKKKKGTIVVISSVAGDRGRQSNYIYGCAKGAISIFLQGLRNRLYQCGVHVITVKPGFVDTPMTVNFPKGRIWVRPEKVAGDIVKAISKKRDVIYTPWFWKYLMMIIRFVPESIFKRLPL